jgi:hypothetical protein
MIYQMVKQNIIIIFVRNNRSLNTLLFVLHDISKLYHLLGELLRKFMKILAMHIKLWECLFCKYPKKFLTAYIFKCILHFHVGIVIEAVTTHAKIDQGSRLLMEENQMERRVFLFCISIAIAMKTL